MRNVIVRATGILVLIVALASVAAFSRWGLRGEEPRTIVLVARNMAFVREGVSAPLNPTVRLRAGERVRFVIRNQDPGMKHDLTIQALGLRSRTLAEGEMDALVFTVPSGASVVDYTCSFHAVLMRGSLAVEADSRASR
jgi:plastocyanin